MHAVAHAQENKAETTLPPPGTGEMCELRPIDSDGEAHVEGEHE
jgi:hypothetical protein